ncbi:MAG: alpha/beta fold hydrolase [Candidatus Binataceae bacterium]|jgi:polyhydroxyalkanoate synthase
MMLSLLTTLPQYFLDGAVRALEGFSRGTQDTYPISEDLPPVTPYELVFETGKARLRRYPALRERCATPLILCNPPIKRPDVLDLMPGRSMVETLTRHGVKVYLIDWVPPSRADSWRGFDAYCNGDIANVVRAVQILENVEQVSLLGYCLGGIMTVVYTALHPDPVKNLIALTMPINADRGEAPVFQMMRRIRPETADLILAAYGNCPAWMVGAGFTGMSLVHHMLDKYVGLYRNQDNAGYVDMFNRFERWVSNEVAFPGQLFKELAVDFFRNNLLAKNQMSVGGETVDLRNIKCPVLSVLGENDDVVDLDTALPFVDLVASSDKRNLVFPTGHVGALVSGGAHKKLWPEVATWLAERDS